VIYHRGNSSPTDYNLDGLDVEVARAYSDLKPHRDAFDGLVVRGMSGVIPGVPLSLRLNCQLLVVRKDTDDCHAHDQLINRKYLVPGSRWLFLDDFISSGSTLRRVADVIFGAQARLVGNYMTQDFRLDLNEHHPPYAAQTAPSPEAQQLADEYSAQLQSQVVFGGLSPAEIKFDAPITYEGSLRG